jgi:hypothetical protein
MVAVRLKENPNALKVAKETGLGYRVVRKIAHAANIDLVGADNPIFQRLSLITDKLTIQALSELLKLKPGTLRNFIYRDELYPSKLFVNEVLAVRLRAHFPDKEAEIAQLVLLANQAHTSAEKITSAAKIKKILKKDPTEFKEAAGLLLHEWRERCGLSLDVAHAAIKFPIVQRNLARIETGDPKLAASIYRDAIKELCGVYKPLDPEKSAAYTQQLENIREHLRY